MDTLDEPVTATIVRSSALLYLGLVNPCPDARPLFNLLKTGPSTLPYTIGKRARSPKVGPPHSSTCRILTNAPRDWDLWGPLILCLTLALMLSYNV